MLSKFIALTLFICGVAIPFKDISKDFHPDDIDCVSVTNYWPFKMKNGVWVHWAFEGQADSDPFHTAYMVEIHPEMAGTIAAGPDDIGGKTIYLPGLGELPIVDRFGDENYRKGDFYHMTYKQRVFGIDVMTPEPLHYLECNWEFR